MGRALLVLECDEDKRKAISWIGKAPVGTRVEFKASKRTLPQNDLLWALLTEVSQQLEHGGRRYDPSQWKAIFLHAFGREVSFLPSLNGKTFLPIELSSSDLSKDEMTDLIEFIIKEASERGVTFREHKTDSHSDEGAPSASPDDASASASLSAASEPEGDAPTSSGSTNPNADMIECATEMLKIAALKHESAAERDEAIEQSKAEWEKRLPAELHQQIASVCVSARAVASGKRTPAQARSWLSEALQCSVEELGG
ncbi:recombination protein NinB [Rhizobium sp. YIM 134829]|uniref:recombination protein NinB n=1 Tax=Rhizobium sp. YIM 134829 TaxID=3390453 RepID=UPI00397AEB05